MIDDSINMTFRNIKVFAQCGNSFTCTSTVANLFDLFIRQFRRRIPVAYRTSTVLNHVSHIALVSSKIKVIGVYARRIAATMEYKHSVWNRAAINYPCGAMSIATP